MHQEHEEDRTRLEELQRRLGSLERQTRRQRWALAVGLLALLWIAQVPKPTTGVLSAKPVDPDALGAVVSPDRVAFAGRIMEADAFVVTHPLTGRNVARLGRDRASGLARLTLFDTDGTERAHLQLIPAEGTSTAQLRLDDADGRMAASLRAESDGAPMLQLRGEASGLRSLLTSSQVSFLGKDGRPGATLGNRQLSMARGHASATLEPRGLRLGRKAELIVDPAGSPRLVFMDAGGATRLHAGLDEQGLPGLVLEVP